MDCLLTRALFPSAGYRGISGAQPDPPQCTMTSHRDREIMQLLGSQGGKRMRSNPPKVTVSGLSSIQLCPQGCRGLGSPLLCPRLCCGPGHISTSATEDIPQAMAAKLSSRESVGSSWCSPVMAEPSEGTGASQEPPPVNPLPN